MADRIVSKSIVSRHFANLLPTATVWDAASGAKVVTLRGHSGRVRSVGWSPDGKRIATGSSDRTVKLWDPVTGQETVATTSPPPGSSIALQRFADAECAGRGAQNLRLAGRAHIDELTHNQEEIVQQTRLRYLRLKAA